MADVVRYVDEKAQDLVEIADAVWNYSEVGFSEAKSAKVQADYLEKQGFKVTRGAGGVPTAFVAEWGEGRPYIGFWVNTMHWQVYHRRFLLKESPGKKAPRPWMWPQPSWNSRSRRYSCCEAGTRGEEGSRDSKVLRLPG